MQVVVIMASSRAAAAPLRDSCTNRRTPEMSTIVRMITTVMQSRSSGVLPNIDHSGKMMSVTVETPARKKRMAVNGLMNASAIRFASGA